MGMSWTWPDVIIGVSAFLLTFFGAIAVVAFVLVRLPADYFEPRVARPFMLARPRPLRWIGLLAKNALGVLIIAIGGHPVVAWDAWTRDPDDAFWLNALGHPWEKNAGSSHCSNTAGYRHDQHATCALRKGTAQSRLAPSPSH